MPVTSALTAVLIADEMPETTPLFSPSPSPLPLLPPLEAVLQPASMEAAITPASIREAIFLSFIMNFSSLWCIKDRDPKQVERKVLSFQRHYSIPPPVSRPDLLFFGFCFLFFRSRRRRESIF